MQLYKLQLSSKYQASTQNPQIQINQNREEMSTTTAILNTSFLVPTQKTPNPCYKPTTNPSPRRRRIRRSHDLTSPRMSLNQPQGQPQSAAEILTSFTKLLWGKSLPPQLLISTVRTTWNTLWLLMMKQLAPADPSGSYTRPPSQFRANFKTPHYFSSRQKSCNFNLYVGLPCPWAHRALIVRALKDLEDVVTVSVASPGLDGSWEFRQTDGYSGELVPGVDKANGCKSLKEVYRMQSGGYNGRSTVPMLWDGERRQVLCNVSYDIIELFNSGFSGLVGNSSLDLSPPELKGKMDEWYQVIYPNVNNGVYRCGFAQTQEAYDIAVDDLFSTLDMLDDHLAYSRYLCGEALTLVDICLFTTLIRFDLVYNVLFKCTKKKILEYPNLHGFMSDIYQIPKVAATCNFEATMDGYFKFLFPLNPGCIRPTMPAGSDHVLLSKPHNRELLSSLDIPTGVSG